MPKPVQDAHILIFLRDECQFSGAELSGDLELVLKLKQALNRNEVEDILALMVDVRTVVQAMVIRRQSRMAALAWILSYSEHLEATPISLLIAAGWHSDTAVAQILSAAHAYCHGVTATRWRMLYPPPASGVVLEFKRPPGGGRKRQPARRTLRSK